MRRSPLALVTAVAGVLPVLALLLWSYEVAPFRTVFLALGVPSLLWLVAVAPRLREQRVALTAGVVGGLLGTLGYDVFRVPFAMGGLRVFAPIESYGVLLLGADTSGPMTHFAGWSFHFLNGIGFGVAYAMVALGRNRWWAVGWAMLLETATVVTPFAETYGLAGKWHLIAVAYAAHVAYGLPLGTVVASARRHPLPLGWAGGSVAVLLVALVVWHRPFALPPEGPATRVVDGRMRPEWVRVEPGGCAAFRNDDDAAYDLRGTSLLPGTTSTVCFDTPGVHRLRLTDEPYSGGFAIVDPAR